MGGGQPSDKKTNSLYSSNQPAPELEGQFVPTAFDMMSPDRRTTEDVSPEEDIEMRMRSRVINDLLNGKLNIDQFLDLHEFDPKNAPTRYLYPMS